MELRLIRHLWGVPGDWEEVFPRFQARGYHGIECGVPPAGERDRFRSLLERHGFDYIAQIFTVGVGVAAHLESFRQQVAAAATLGPRLINAHSGRDAWSEDEAGEFFGQALAVEAATGVPVAHETHRGRVLFNPWVTARLLRRFPALGLCCDFSHWVCVAERLLEDDERALALATRHCRHLHARVGYEQGPQVPDPRAPEYAPHLAAHERWWRMIWDAQAARGDAVTTLTPEFGPPGYLHTLPYTQAPVSDLEAICDWQAQRQAEQFAKWRAAAA
jgi:hypothetical protein